MITKNPRNRLVSKLGRCKRYPLSTDCMHGDRVETALSAGQSCYPSFSPHIGRAYRGSATAQRCGDHWTDISWDREEILNSGKGDAMHRKCSEDGMDSRTINVSKRRCVKSKDVVLDMI